MTYLVRAVASIVSSEMGQKDLSPPELVSSTSSMEITGSGSLGGAGLDSMGYVPSYTTSRELENKE